MYSILFSRIEVGMNIVKDRMLEILPKNPKVAVLPWAFPVEIDADKLDNDFFKKGERKYNRYINELKKIGIEETNITVCNYYRDSKEKLKNIIKSQIYYYYLGVIQKCFFKKYFMILRYFMI